MAHPFDDEQATRHWAQMESDALSAAIAQVEAAGRGRDVSEIEAQLVDELRARRCFMSKMEIRIEAFRIHDPDWFTKNPDALDEMLAAEAYSEEEQRQTQETDRTLERLQSIVDRCRGVRSFSIGARRTMDGFEYQISISPCTPRLARRIQRKAAPTPVLVEPQDDQLELESGTTLRTRSAIESVKADARGAPLADVERQLEIALEQRESYLPEASVHFIARGMSDPWWPSKHPVAAIFEFIQEFRTRKDVDPGSVRLESETAHLDSRLDLIPQIVRRRSRRTRDGILHEVIIEPWSDELATQIHQLAAPIPVTVTHVNRGMPDR